MPYDKDSLAVPIEREVVEEIAHAVRDVPQALAFGEGRVDAGRSACICSTGAPVILP